MVDLKVGDYIIRRYHTSSGYTFSQVIAVKQNRYRKDDIDISYRIIKCFRNTLYKVGNTGSFPLSKNIGYFDKLSEKEAVAYLI